MYIICLTANNFLKLKRDGKNMELKVMIFLEYATKE